MIDVDKGQDLNARSEPLVDRLIKGLGVFTLSFVAVLFLIWVGGGFR